MDRTRAGAFALEAIDFIANHFDDDDAELGNLILVAEVRTKEDGHSISNVMYYSDDHSSIAQIGMLSIARSTAMER